MKWEPVRSDRVVQTSEVQQVLIVAISGSHGVGKTTLIQAIGRARPQWKTHPEITRALIPILGYQSPYDIVAENGIAVYETVVLSHWSALAENSQRRRNVNVELVDRSPVDSLGYYYLLRTSQEIVHETLLVRLTRACIPKIQMHLFVPRLPMAVEFDEFQREETQAELEHIILDLYDKLNVSYTRLISVTVEDRLEEALCLISRLAVELSRFEGMAPRATDCSIPGPSRLTGPGTQCGTCVKPVL